MELRPATAADGPAIADVRLAIGSHHDDSGADAGYRAHLIEHGRLWVAVEADRVVAFAGTRDIAGARMLCDLFVHPARHGNGLGRRLLDAVMSGASAAFTFASDDPRAMPLYVRAGMVPVWPLVCVHGTTSAACEGSRGDGSVPDPAGPTPVDAETAGAMERLLTGVDRGVEHRYWAMRPGAVAMVGRTCSGRELGPGAGGGNARAAVDWVGAAVRLGTSARIEHLVVADGVDPCAAFDAFVAALGVTAFQAHVPGPSPVLRHLLDRRAQVVDVDLHLTSEPGLVDTQLHVLHPGLC